jgi:hypothetical protein
MNKQKLYLELLSFTFFIVIIVLVAFNETRLTVYISLFAIGYYSITVLFRPKKKFFDIVSAGFLIFFCYTILMNIITYVRFK